MGDIVVCICYVSSDQEYKKMKASLDTFTFTCPGMHGDFSQADICWEGIQLGANNLGDFWSVLTRS